MGSMRGPGIYFFITRNEYLFPCVFKSSHRLERIECPWGGEVNPGEIGKGGREMRRVANFILALMLTVSFAGCAGMHHGRVSKDAKVKCPKCGHIFTVDEGRRALEGP